MIDPITYSKLQWKDKEVSLITPVNANNLNRIENGVDAATTKINEIVQKFNDLTQDMERVRIYDSEEDLPEVGQAKTIYFIKESEEETT